MTNFLKIFLVSILLTGCDADHDPDQDDVLDLCREATLLRNCIWDLDLIPPNPDPNTFECPESQGAVLEHCRLVSREMAVKPRWQVEPECQGSVQ